MNAINTMRIIHKVYKLHKVHKLHDTLVVDVVRLIDHAILVHDTLGTR